MIIDERRAKIAARRQEQRERSTAGTTAAVEKRRTRSESIRQLLEDRSKRSRKAAAEARKARNALPRGVDRVPDRLKGLQSKGQQLVTHEDDNYATRRLRHLATGRQMAPGTNQPAHNPARASRNRGKRRRPTDRRTPA